ncbi:MAG: YcxB family protein [Halocynthiibacter sp.]
MIRTTYTISEDEFMRHSTQYFAHQGLSDKGNVIVAAASAVAACVPWGIFSLQVIFGFAAVFFLLAPRLRDRNWRRFYQRSQKYKSPITALFSDQYVEVQSTEGENRLAWNFFKKWFENEEAFFISAEKRQFSVIPKSGLESQSDEEALRALLNQHLRPMRKRWF